ncbi:OmpA family protein [Ectothiorhodospira haloalkaliphila]|nr:OmpA family protein [Ectothiorhodospira haloalkaliphila]
MTKAIQSGARSRAWLKRVAMITSLAVLLSGCMATMDRQGQGTVIGALGGAIVGSQLDGKRGAAVGAIIGGGAGYLIGRHLDEQEAALRNELGQQMSDGSVSLERTGGNEAMVLSMRGNVLFGTGSASVSPTAYDSLNRLARAWHDNPDLNIIITGHTDNVGPLEFNRDLSARRAENVALYLVKRGVPYRNLYTRGAGELAPVANNNTARGRSQNRRVDLVFYPASVPPPEVRLVYTHDTEPRSTEPRVATHQPQSGPPHQRPEAAYAFTDEDRALAQRQQQEVRGSEETEPLSPIRSASELVKHL